MRVSTTRRARGRCWYMALLAVMLAPWLNGCATVRATVNGWSADATGLSHAQRSLRTQLEQGEYAAILAAREEDALLRALTTGISAFYAAQYGRSAAQLDTAVLLSDERVTTSVSRSALSLVTNELASAYQLRRTERLFVPYYAMLSHSRLAQWEDAAVEARRLSAVLAQQAGDMDDGERSVAGVMHYLAGSVFERSGEQDASAVAYRNARALLPELGRPSPSASRDMGDVLVLVERGFVAHRVTETLRVPLESPSCERAVPACHDEREGLRERQHERGVQPPPAPASPGLSRGVIPLRQRDVVSVPAGSREEPPSNVSVHRGRWWDRDDDNAHTILVAFPSLRHSPLHASGAIELLLDGSRPADTGAGIHLSGEVDAATDADARRERSAIIAREVARATARVAIVAEVERKTGEVGGHLAELGATFLARADVRSWHLLPRRIEVMRLRLPAGPHTLALRSGDGSPPVTLGRVSIISGGLVIVPARLWREGGSPERVSCPLPSDCGR